MNNYRWEFGVEWGAAIDPSSQTSYMPVGFVSLNPPESPVIKRSRVLVNDVITIMVFDLTRGGIDTMQQLKSLIITPRPNFALQPDLSPFDALEPLFVPTGQQQSYFFEGQFNSWTTIVPIHVVDGVAEMKFLLKFDLQAVGSFDDLRHFVHDPEMVVGPFG